MEAEKAFGAVLRELRLAKQLSQEQLALEADLQRNYVSLLERGLNSATIKTVFKLAPILGIDPSAILKMVEVRLAAEDAGAAPKRRRARSPGADFR